MKKILTTACVSIALGASAADVSKQVQADFADYAKRAFVHYAVPAMSENQRLPDAYPADGLANAPVKIFTARDEFEPGAFVVWGVRDLGKVRFELGEFKQGERIGGGGEKKGEKVGGEKIFPKENLDLKLVKCWYQNLNAWFSYFSDCGDAKLVPELLVNDEDLIRCDTAKRANYARIVGQDGKTHEMWINPPKEMDFDDRNAVFKSMAYGFQDAATLQPVALPKDEFRSFILTVHTTRDVAPGVYRGEIKVKGEGEQRNVSSNPTILGTIPVEIHVADYVLPQPKCYADPTKDFYVSSYSYLSLQNIQGFNGGDFQLAVKQREAIYRNLATHNQMLLFPGSPYPSEEAFSAFETMGRVGMRRDVCMASFVPWTSKEDYDKLPKRIADELDRRLGHHNCYDIYGDEPYYGAWLEKELLQMMETWKPHGFKFAIAGSECVYRQIGFAMDWENIPCDATDRAAPLKRQWQNQPGGRVAWYANQHVGPENPALQRRQNGLAAWLNGYTCLCNYAHHLGSYNDNLGDLYRPMVYAYGTYNGVLDTLAWEGFREGVDDIRYATLLCDLAHKVRKNPDVKLRHLAGKAFQFLSLIELDRYSADTVRAEMRRMIAELLKYAKPDPAVETPVLPPKPAAADAALAAELKPIAADLAAKKPAAIEQRRKIYEKYYRWADLADLLEKEGDLAGAAKYAGQAFQFKRASDLRVKALRDRKAGVYSRSFLAWGTIFSRPELWEDKEVLELLAYVPNANTNNWIGGKWGTYGCLEGGEALAPSKRDSWIRAYRFVAAVADKVGVKGMGLRAATFGIQAFAERRDFKSAREVIARYLSGDKPKPTDVYRLKLVDAALAAEMKDLGKVLAAYEKANLPKDMKKDERMGAIRAVGVLANQIADEAALRAVEAYRQGLYKPEPRRQYKVVFSDKTLEDAASWENPAIPEAVCDRKYGGTTELLESDVTTGSRTVGKSSDKFEPMRMKVAADAWGIHIRFESFDPKCLEFETHKTNGGNMEGYIAPGKNRPYVCFFKNDSDDDWTIFNTCYDARGQQLVRKNCPQYLKARRVFEKGRMIHYLAFAWDNYVNDLPKDGSVWDFEPLYWGRTGQSSWNGVKVIHGRSTWGELVFSLTDAQRAKILRRLEPQVYWRFRYETANVDGHNEGAARHWSDTNVGDPAFWKEVVNPYVAPLLEKGKALYEDPTDATLLKLEADGTLAKWQNLVFDLDLMRQRWLEK